MDPQGEAFARHGNAVSGIQSCYLAQKADFSLRSK